MRLEYRMAASALAAAVALAGCQGEQKAATQATARGEILPGSASDAMLPLDSVRSQPPLAPKPDASGKVSPGSKGGGSTSPVASSAAAASDDRPAEKPKAEPQAESAPDE